MNKTAIKFLSIIAPKYISNIAYKHLTNPQTRKLRVHEDAILAKAKKEVVKFLDYKIQTYKWGTGKETVFLTHGWEGQAGNFADLIEKLLAQNYSVFAFDAPSHGYSSKGQTSLFEFTELVGSLIRQTGSKKLISHSFGGVANTFALYKNQDLEIEKYVLLTTPDKFSERIDSVATQIGITEKVKQILINRLESEMPIKVNELAVSSFVKEINVKEALIIHDKNDKVIPIAQSKNIVKNWPQCKLEAIEGTGHFRILRTEKVLSRVIDFLK